MANLYLVWNIKGRSVESIHESSADATTAIRKFVEHAGARVNDKVSGASASGFEVITVTR